MATQQSKPEEYAHELPFDKPTVSFVQKLTKPMFEYFTPEFYGIENVDPDKPTLFVTNHTVFGVFDGPMFGAHPVRDVIHAPVKHIADTF